MYIMRQIYTIAIVCMVKSPAHAHNTTDDNGTWRINEKLYEEGGCVLERQGTVKYNEGGELKWSRSLQSWTLSSYYYGYICTQILGGYLGDRFGTKHVFGTAVLGAVICTLVTPVAARTHVGLVIAVRVVMGLFTGMCFPSTHAMWGRWAPPMERSKLAGIMYAAVIPGVVLSWGVAGLFCGLSLDNGWPLMFYFFGGVSVLWWISWQFLMYNTPTQHPRINQAEKRYIVSAIGKGVYGQTDTHHVPWGAIWRSPAVWALIIAHMTSNYTAYTIQTSIPMYMKDVLKFDIKQNGLFSSLPFVVAFFMSLMATVVTDTLRERKLVTTVCARRFVQSVAYLLPATFLISMGFMDCSQRPLAVVLLILSVGFIGVNRAGYVVNHVDIAPRYAGVIMGISNTFATLPGMVAPVIAGILTPTGSREEWQKVFYICGALAVTGCVVFCACVRGVEQDWAKGKVTVKKDIMFTTIQQTELNSDEII